MPVYHSWWHFHLLKKQKLFSRHKHLNRHFPLLSSYILPHFIFTTNTPRSLRPSARSFVRCWGIAMGARWFRWPRRWRYCVPPDTVRAYSYPNSSMYICTFICLGYTFGSKRLCLYVCVEFVSTSSQRGLTVCGFPGNEICCRLRFMRHIFCSSNCCLLQLLFWHLLRSAKKICNIF